MQRFWMLALAFIFLPNYRAQDMFFSQFDRCLHVLNPSQAGNFDGFERVSFQQKNQWMGAGTTFSSSLGCTEFTLGKNDFNTSSYLGSGIFFLRDVGGDARFGNSSIGASLSGHLVTSKNTRLSAGIQLGYTNRSGDLSKLLWYSQWNGNTFDANIPVNEPSQLAKFSYVDATIGTSFSLLSRNQNAEDVGLKGLNAGFFVQHLNRPKLRYNEITTDRLYRKTGIHIQGEIAFSRFYALELKTVQLFQGRHYAGRYGFYFKSLFKQGADITRIKNDSYLSLGFYLGSRGTFSPGFILDLGGLQMGFNYDIELSQISRAYRNSLEFSLNYAFTKNSIFHKRKLA
jgi:type IX secretion system PorP/SprF family membrane protein